MAQAKNGEEAVSLYAESRPDVVLMDMQMPVSDGIESTTRLLELDKAARVIMLTSYDTDEDIHLALRAGACGYLLKESSEQELLASIEKAAAGETFISPAVAAKLADSLRREPLTARELEVLKLIAEGRSNKEIAGSLFVTESTVKLHANKLFQKLNVSNRAEAIKTALQRGLIRL